MITFGSGFDARVDAGCVIITDVNTAAVTFVLPFDPPPPGPVSFESDDTPPPCDRRVLLLTLVGTSVVTTCDVTVVWFNVRVVLRPVITALVTTVKAVVYIDVTAIVTFWPVDINIELDDVSENTFCNADVDALNIPVILEEELFRFRPVEMFVAAKGPFGVLVRELEAKIMTELENVEDEVLETEAELGSEDDEGDGTNVCVSKVEDVDVRIEFVDNNIVELEERDVAGRDDVLFGESEVDREEEIDIIKLELEVVFA